jgi:hypothetical protein
MHNITRSQQVCMTATKQPIRGKCNLGKAFLQGKNNCIPETITVSRFQHHYHYHFKFFLIYKS